jgi:hypothetical protein
MLLVNVAYRCRKGGVIELGLHPYKAEALRRRLADQVWVSLART